MWRRVQEEGQPKKTDVESLQLQMLFSLQLLLKSSGRTWLL
jgi:hypothetical protein